MRTVRNFLKFRKEIEILSKSEVYSENAYSYKRMALMTFIDTIFNLPVLFFVTIKSATGGTSNAINLPYISWDNVHNGDGGKLPGASLSTIIQVPASAWSRSPSQVLANKWNMWVYVGHALVFFGVFGTTPKMREWYTEIVLYIPRKLGYARKTAEDPRDTLVVRFAPNPRGRKAPKYIFYHP